MDYDKEEYLDITKKHSSSNKVIEDKYIAIYLPNQSDLNISGDHIFSIAKGNKYLHIHKSYLHFEGQVLSSAAGNPPFTDADNITLINNAMMYLFSNAEYQIDGKQIELINNLGQVTTIMGLLKRGNRFNDEDGLNMCWNKDTSTAADSNEFEVSTTAPGVNYRPKRNKNYNKGFDMRKRHLFDIDKKGAFSFNVPLSAIFGFCEGYKDLIFGAEHSLRFTRQDDGANALFKEGGANGIVKLSKFIWYVSEKKLGQTEKNLWLERITSNKTLSISYDARLISTKSLPAGLTFHTIDLNSAGGAERPGKIFVALQTGKTNGQTNNKAIFDHCNLTDIYADVNNVRFPARVLNLDFSSNNYSDAYTMLTDFRKQYYGCDDIDGGCQIDVKSFKELYPIFVIDVIKRDEEAKRGPSIITLTLTFSEGTPVDTTLFSIILTNREVEISAAGENLKRIGF